MIYLSLIKQKYYDCIIHILYKNCSEIKKKTMRRTCLKKFKEILLLNWCIDLIRNNLYQNCEKIPLPYYKSFTYIFDGVFLIKSFFSVRNTVYKLHSEKIGRILDLSIMRYYNGTTIIKVCTSTWHIYQKYWGVRKS